MTTTAAQQILTQSRYGQRRRRRGQPATPEGGIKQQILDGLALRKIAAYRIGVGGFTAANADGSTRFVALGSKGVPDLVALVPGVGTVWIEVKTARGRLSPEQVGFRDDCRRAGAVHVVATGFGDVEPWLVPRGAV